MLFIGSICYLCYTVSVGGDFMAGRLYTPVILVCVILLYFVKLPPKRLKTLPIILLCVVGATQYISRTYTIPGIADINNKKETYIISGGVADEMYFYSSNNLWQGAKDGWYKNHEFYKTGESFDEKEICIAYNAGIIRLSTYDSVHIVDINGLTDPLIARLPARKDPVWRVGHLTRDIPAGYIETLETGVNVIDDERIARYYDKLHLITSGPIFSKERFKTIIDMNLGKYD
jgi:arabinofuranosyltransferase